MAPSVRPFFHADSNTWSYVVHAPGGSEAAVIDPVLDFDAKSARTSTTSAQRIVDFVRERGLAVRWLLETHAHADHLSAAHWLKTQHWPDATLAIGSGIREVQKTFRPIFNLGEHFPIDGSQFDRLFADAEGFRIGQLEARVIAVPGHTSDSNAYLVGDAHQPMHAGDRDDAGGNGYQISLTTALEPEAYARNKYIDGVMGTNLHSIWDYYILGATGFGSDRAAVTPYANRLDALPWPPSNEAPLFAPMAWARESCRLIEARHIYPDTHKLDDGYLDAFRPLTEQRIRQAAWRLAQLLNDTLGGR